MDKKIDFPLFQRMVGCGTITLMSTDIDSPVKEIHCIKKPREAKRIMDELLIAHKKYLPQFADTIARLEEEGVTIKDDVARELTEKGL